MKCENKRIHVVFPPYSEFGCVKLLTYAISVSLTIELHENNIDTSRITNEIVIPNDTFPTKLTFS